MLGAARANLTALTEMSKIVRVVAVDKSPASSFSTENLMFRAVDFSEPAELDELVAHLDIAGVYSLSDHGILPAARIINRLGLGGIDLETSNNFLDKTRMRKLWEANGLAQPVYRIVESLDEAIDAADEIGYPVILKPAASGGGGRGVVRLDSRQQLLVHFSQSAAENRYSNLVLIEEFIPGIESSLEMVMLNKRSYPIALSSKSKADSPFQVATEIRYPSGLSEEICSRIYELCEQAAIALGMTTGIAHFEVITASSGYPYLVEVGARAGGGHTLHPIASHVSGVNYPQLIALLSLGRESDVEYLLHQVRESGSAVYSFPVVQTPGVVEEIGYFLPAEIESSVHTEVWRSIGDFVSGLSSSMDRLGCAISLGKSLDITLSDNRLLQQGFHLRFQTSTDEESKKNDERN